jgi:hypothetical protein
VFCKIFKEVQRCQYLNTSVTNVGVGWNSWKKERPGPNTFAKIAEVPIYKKCYRVSQLDRATNLRHGAMKPVRLERAASHRKDPL